MDYKYKHTDNSKEVEYPKLVRDNIPAINKQRWGLELDHRIAKDDKEYLFYLLKKLSEESEELQETPLPDLVKELADIYEIIDSLVALVGIKKAAIIEYQAIKRKDQGSFKERVLMLSKNMPEK